MRFTSTQINSAVELEELEKKLKQDVQLVIENEFASITYLPAEE